ncbi:hypothetical protein GGR50DRAFT_654569 [Xylaria sp. CBS 124048]|nr:hypothetical protein GGR50DRAFT_654569 [Xylaria sp. CBS 124048]
MRPLHGDDTWNGRRRQQRPGVGGFHDQDVPNTTTTSSMFNNHMSFFLADEASLDSHREQSAFPALSRDSKQVTGGARKDDRGYSREHARSRSSSARASVFSQSPSLLSQVQPSISRPITPIMLGQSCLGSSSSSLSSRRASIASSLSDRATSYNPDFVAEPTINMLESGSSPQLVMPSIRMPSRRPFTETGKNIGRLKILLAGDSGVGKTSLLKAIVQACHHIVHVDPISSLGDSSQTTRQPDITAAFPRESLSTATISEVHASTRPYPEWWQELDAPHMLHKRKIRGDSVLERNICFVDTPGYSHDSSIMKTITDCVEYVEFQLSKVSSDDLSDSDLINMLGGDGGCQVDVVLYLISRTLKPADLEYIRRLTPLTNVIPILAQAELLSDEQKAAHKEEINGQLESAGIRPFTFTPTVAQLNPEQPIPSVPYTASSAMMSDHDIMDASLLMSPEYVQPLIPTDLAFLVDKIFSPDGASWLRHSAAKKYLQWRRLAPRRPRELYEPLGFPVPAYTSALGEPSLALARLGESHQSCETTQLRVADWATKLQQSLASERTRYEAIARGERAVWLAERLHECVQDGIMVGPGGMREVNNGGQRRTSRRAASSRTSQHQDPLGLLQVAADLKAKGWVALEVLGSLSVFGLAFWISRRAWPAEGITSIDEWMRHWGLEM